MKKGFTLIELLVVISIIGLLSSVVLASLSTARNKGKDALIKSSMLQFRNLLTLEYSDTGSYAAMQIGSWVQLPTTGALPSCDSMFAIGANTNINQANAICKTIYNNSSSAGAGPTTYVGSRLFVGVQGGLASGATNVTHYSIMAFLPGEGVWLCIGSSGQSKVTVPANRLDDLNAFFAEGTPAPIGCRSNP